MKKICHKPKCGGETFTITVNDSCAECEHNGAFDHNTGEYFYGKGELDGIGLERNQAEEDGECRLGQSEDNGCFLFTCSDCGNKSHMHLVK